MMINKKKNNINIETPLIFSNDKRANRLKDAKLFLNLQITDNENLKSLTSIIKDKVNNSKIFLKNINLEDKGVKKKIFNFFKNDNLHTREKMQEVEASTIVIDKTVNNYREKMEELFSDQSEYSKLQILIVLAKNAYLGREYEIMYLESLIKELGSKRSETMPEVYDLAQNYIYHTYDTLLNEFRSYYARLSKQTLNQQQFNKDISSKNNTISEQIFNLRNNSNPPSHEQHSTSISPGLNTKTSTPNVNVQLKTKQKTKPAKKEGSKSDLNKIKAKLKSNLKIIDELNKEMSSYKKRVDKMESEIKEYNNELCERFSTICHLEGKLDKFHLVQTIREKRKEELISRRQRNAD